MKKKIAATVLLASLLGACATVPTPLQGTFAKTTPRDAVTQSETQPVRWGGQIIKVEPKADATCFEIIARTLDMAARPERAKDGSNGRFIACHAGFYDPEEYTRGRDITVVGNLVGTEHGKVGEYDYTYPRVEATSIYLWAKRPLYTASPYYDPWLTGPGWGGYYGFGWGWGPYWAAPPIIIRERGGHHPPPPSRPAPPPPPRR